MRAHRQIIEDAGGDQGIVRALGSPPGVRPGRVRFWRRRNSIPAEWWSALAQSGVASLDELAAAVASRVSNIGHAATLAPVEALGAENPERNVSRTGEPGSSSAATALPHAAASHQVAQADAIERAAGHDAVVGPAARHAGYAPPHGDIDESLSCGAAAGGVEFGRVEVGEADLDPAGPALSAPGLDAEAVAIADIDDRAGEGSARPQFGGHGAAIRNSFAGIGQGRGGKQKEGGDEGDSDHGVSLAAESYRGVSA